ncbi:unnamed protein product [Parascedosporium putredinis]|uniref:Uncharacterized protein n=1 Tax=Parascedosporium putredinis TaxID=1442378 RepID=A0A9P1GYE0_9PEZI|nr:unnamed protein product [Parascedosporium putredinis]CAI7990673.1 unnamed protein product [Parascedosporium putredinis]
MSATRAQSLRTLTRARAPVRTRATQFKRGYASENPNVSGASAGANDPTPKKGFPFIAVGAAVGIPAIGWFFWGKSKDESSPSSTGEKTRGGTFNEEPSRSVPDKQAKGKEEKPASTKAVAPDNERLRKETTTRGPMEVVQAARACTANIMALVAIVDYLQDVLSRLPQGTNRPPWSPTRLRVLAYTCPCMVFARIDNRLDDLELGGDGLSTPNCDVNRVCALSCFHTVCCFLCCFSTGNELVWQRERARNFGFRSAERFEYIEATFKPFKFLVNSEEGVHSLCAERARRRRFYEGYKANEPMRLPMRAGGGELEGQRKYSENLWVCPRRL